MRKSLKRLAWIVILSAIVVSCKKDGSQFPAFANHIQNAKAWYQNEQKKSTAVIKSSKGETVSLSFNPDWDKVETENINGRFVMAVPVSTNLEKLSIEGIQYSLVIQQDGNSYTQRIVSREGTDTSLEKSVSELHSLAFGNTALSNSDNSISNTRVYSENFRLTKMVSQSSSGTNVIEGNQLVKMNLSGAVGLNGSIPAPRIMAGMGTEIQCTHWYLVIEYTNSRGEKFYDWIYLDTVCQNVAIDWIDHGLGGGPRTIDIEYDYGDLGAPENSDAGSILESEVTLDGNLETTKLMKWKFYEGKSVSFFSTERGTVRETSSGKTYIAFSNVGSSKSGVWASGSVEVTPFLATPEIINSGSIAKSTITYNITFQATPYFHPVSGLMVTFIPPALSGLIEESATWDTNFNKL